MSSLASCRARCYTCGATWEANNARGVAVQHSRRYGHHVWVEEIRRYEYRSGGLVAPSTGGGSRTVPEPEAQTLPLEGISENQRRNA